LYVCSTTKIILKLPEGLKITIITVCKNSERFLNETINSVINQTYQNIQYILIDGNSTDATVKIIKQYSSNIDYWVSETDDGMYDAINKGLKHATGDYILILNSDDVLANNDTIKNAVNLLRNDRLDYYYGNLIKLKDGKNKKVKLFPVTFKQLLLSTHGTFVPHPCFFISNEFNKELAGYDLTYQYASDYDYILRALFTAGRKGKYLNMYISKFRIHENSITATGKIDFERKTILQQHGYYQHSYLSRLFFYYTLWIYYKIINLGQSYKTA
jgi:glycosyltransferase involved in cell wall biosynthesis